MQRHSAFSFQCQRCGRCCHDQAIQLNPYDILCLARHLGLGTGQFMALHTTNGGLFLRFTPQGACGFLTPRGCGVHPARPLLCRLYPLARELDPPRGESFSLLERHPRCEALVGGQGRLQDYLDQQGAGRFLEAADLYLTLVLEAQSVLERRLPPGASLAAATGQALAGLGRAAPRAGDPWLDVDGLLGREVPEDDPWRAMQCHLAAIRTWLARLDQA
jgi:uncharacterized protein